MTEIWILVYVITTGGYNESHPVTSGTIEFGSAEACQVGAKTIQRASALDKKLLKCIPSGRFLYEPELKQGLAEKDD